MVSVSNHNWAFYKLRACPALDAGPNGRTLCEWWSDCLCRNGLSGIRASFRWHPATVLKDRVAMFFEGFLYSGALDVHLL